MAEIRAFGGLYKWHQQPADRIGAIAWQ